MKLGRVTDVRAHKSLEELSNQVLPLRTAYKLKNILAKIREEHNKYEELRKANLQTHGDKGEDGALVVDEKGNVKLSQENLQKFVDDLNSLMDLDIELQPLKIDELGANVMLSARDLESLEGFIVE
jgi:hypothetical protein